MKRNLKCRVLWLFTALSLSSALLPVAPTMAEEKKTETISYAYSAGEGKTYTREMEKLGRGLVAIKNGSNVYLSWRLLDSEDAVYGSADSNVSFKVYKDNSEIATVSNKTNYTVSGGKINSTYAVAPVIDGKEGERETAKQYVK